MDGGTAYVEVRYGNRPMQWRPGNGQIAKLKKDQVRKFLETLRTAVENGDLDEQLAKAAAVKRGGKESLHPEREPSEVRDMTNDPGARAAAAKLVKKSSK